MIESKSSGISKRSETSDFIGTFQDASSQSGKGKSQMSDGHLISDGKIIKMRSLLSLAIPHAGKIPFYLSSLLESVFICIAFAGDLRTGVIGDIDILGAAIAFSGTEKFMIDGTFTRQTLFFLFGAVSNRADKFFSGP